MTRFVTVALAALLISPAAFAATDDVDDSPLLPAAASRHADEIASKRAAYERAITLGAATPKSWAPIPEPSPIDVTHYDLDLHIDVGRQLLSGTARIEIAAVEDGLDTVELDVDLGLRVLAVVLLNDDRFAADSPRTLRFSHEENRLAVALPRALAAGDAVTLMIPYGGRASRFGDGVNWWSHGGAPEIFTFAEPFGARVWFPCNDRPDDKATVDLTVTAPSSLTVASNGLETDRIDNGDGTATTTWSSRYPVATYLVVMNISDYEYREWTYNAQDGSTMPVVAFMYPDAAAAGEVDLAITPDMVGVLAERFDEYPFVEEKYGNLTAAFGGGMEHQTLTTIGNFFGNPWMEWLNVHELGHQWWGDWVTCDDWRELWLNESFATYAEFVWAEEAHGQEFLDQYRREADWPQFFAGPLYDNPVPFSRTIYDGGGVRLHMLRYVVGDDAFFEGLRDYREAFAGASATTEGFRAAMESASGMDLEWFFDQWVYGANRPRFQYEWEAISGPAVRLTVTQEHSNAPYFQTPMDVRVDTSAGTETHRIWLEAVAEQTLDVQVGTTPTDVVLDPDHRILSHLSRASEPDLDLGPDYPDLDAGQVHGGETTTIVVPLTNVGGSDLEITDIQSSNSSRFRVVSPTQFPLTLAPSEAVDLEIDFSSTSPGAQSAMVYVFSTDPTYSDGVAYLPVSGRGAPFADPTLQAPSSASAGSVPIGGVGEASISVLNYGAAPLSLAGTLAGHGFSLGSVIPSELAGGASTTVFVRFQPEAVGEATGSLTLITNDPDDPQHVVALTGNGVGAPRLEITPATLDFGIAGADATATLTIGNSGTDTLIIHALDVEGPFTVPSFFTFPIVVEPAAVVGLDLGFEADAPGGAQGSLLVRSNDPSIPRAVVPLSAHMPDTGAELAAWAFPAAASTGGIGGARWSSNASLLNPTDQDLILDLGFRPASPRGQTDLTIAIPAHSQRQLADLVAAIGQTGAGAIAMRVSGPGFVGVSRTFSSESTGTYGQFIPAIASADAQRGDQTLVLPGLAGNGGFRTNIGAHNLSDQELELVYELFSPDGASLGERTLTVGPHAYAQHNQVIAALTQETIRGGYAVLRAGSADARLIAYASMVDDGSHDPTLILPVAVDAVSPSSWIVPVVASNPGAAQTMWRTDLSLASLSDAPAEVTVRLHLDGSETDQSFSLQPGDALQLEDVVRATFGGSGSGWLEITGSGPGVVASSRTYNDAASGTYGQYVPARAESDATGPNEVVVLAGLSSADRFRTNLGITSLADSDTTVTARLFRDDGELLGEIPIQVPARGFVQVVRILADELGYTGSAWATLESTDPAADYFAHASVVDGDSGDPVYIPAQKPAITAW